jgi:hypothetical protein
MGTHWNKSHGFREKIPLMGVKIDALVVSQLVRDYDHRINFRKDACAWGIAAGEGRIRDVNAGIIELGNQKLADDDVISLPHSLRGITAPEFLLEQNYKRRKEMAVLQLARLRMELGAATWGM